MDYLDLWRQVVAAETEVRVTRAALTYPGAPKLEQVAESELRDRVAVAELKLRRVRQRWLLHASGSGHGGADMVKSQVDRVVDQFAFLLRELK